MGRRRGLSVPAGEHESSTAGGIHKSRRISYVLVPLNGGGPLGTFFDDTYNITNTESTGEQKDKEADIDSQGIAWEVDAK